MNKVEMHRNICLEMNEMYKRKNADYGDSVGELYDKLGDISLLTRISDKYNRLMSLLSSENKEVNYESIDDTILDMANYCVIWAMERELRLIPHLRDRGLDFDGDISPETITMSEEMSRILEMEEKFNSFTLKMNKNIDHIDNNFKNTDNNFNQIYSDLEKVYKEIKEINQKLCATEKVEEINE